MVEEFGSSQIHFSPHSLFALEYLQTKKRRNRSGEAVTDFFYWCFIMVLLVVIDLCVKGKGAERPLLTVLLLFYREQGTGFDSNYCYFDQSVYVVNLLCFHCGGNRVFQCIRSGCCHATVKLWNTTTSRSQQRSYFTTKHRSKLSVLFQWNNSEPQTVPQFY